VVISYAVFAIFVGYVEIVAPADVAAALLRGSVRPGTPHHRHRLTAADQEGKFPRI
jgi:hypothetical protein